MKQWFNKKYTIEFIVIGLSLLSFLGIGVRHVMASAPVNPVTITENLDPEIKAHRQIEKRFMKNQSGHSIRNLAKSAITSDATRNLFLKQLGDSALYSAQQAIKSQVIERYVQAIIDWVEGGYNGSIIVGDWGDLLEDAGQAAVGNFVQEIGAGFLCDPFSVNVQIALLPVADFRSVAGCTLNDIVSNVEDFYKDFQTGDWIGYRETWVPSNNFYGSTLIAMDELDKRKFAARTAAQNEAIAGQGFLSRKVCNADGCEIKTPGTFVGEAITSSLIKIPADSIVSGFVNAKDLSNYLGAIFNAAINQLVRKGVEGFRSTKDVPATTVTSFGQPGAAELQLGSIIDTLENSQFENNRLYTLTQIDNAIVPYQSAGDVIRRSLEKQSTIVSYADLCTDAQLTTIGINKAFEENTLTLLEEEIVDLQTFIDELNRARSAVNGVEAGNNAELSLTVNAIQPLLGADGNAVLQNAIEENEAINEDYNTKVPDLTINCLAF